MANVGQGAKGGEVGVGERGSSDRRVGVGRGRLGWGE